jgi:hypothetical protein
MAIRPDLKVYLPATSIPDRSRVVTRFVQKRDKLYRELMRVQTRMDKPEYQQRVPATVQETDRQVMKQYYMIISISRVNR